MPIGLEAVAVFADVAPLALEARQVVFEEHQVAFFEALALEEFLPGLPDAADVFVAHDDVLERGLIVLDVAAANAGNFNLEDRRLVVDLRHLKLAKLG